MGCHGFSNLAAHSAPSLSALPCYDLPSLPPCSQFAQLVSQWWLTLWSSDTSYTEHPVHFYQGIYALIGVGAAVSGGIRVLVMNGMGVRASRKLHAQLLRAVLRAPLTWYDTTPLGRILTRFSKDVDRWVGSSLQHACMPVPAVAHCAVYLCLSISYSYYLLLPFTSPCPCLPLFVIPLCSIDTSLVASLGMLGMCIFFVAGSLAAIIFATPWFALALLPTAAIYVYINRYFRNAAREIVSRLCCVMTQQLQLSWLSWLKLSRSKRLGYFSGQTVSCGVNCLLLHPCLCLPQHLPHHVAPAEALR